MYIFVCIFPQGLNPARAKSFSALDFSNDIIVFFCFQNSLYFLSCTSHSSCHLRYFSSVGGSGLNWNIHILTSSSLFFAKFCEEFG